MVNLHFAFFCVYTNLVVRDMLPGVSVDLDHVSGFKFNIPVIWLILHAINVHSYGYAIVTAVFCVLGEVGVLLAPAMRPASDEIFNQ